MKCPHCNVGIHWSPDSAPLLWYTFADETKDRQGWEAQYLQCPECNEPIIRLLRGEPVLSSKGDFVGVEEDAVEQSITVWPQSSNRYCADEVPGDLRQDFMESARVLELSPKSSAALSRRCLQHLLKTYAKTTQNDLSRQIDQVISSGSLPSNLAEQLGAVRNIGNFAAHTQKSTNSGEVLDVEPEEAEWNLEVLEDLFEHFFVKPERIRVRKERLNEKLGAAGKPLLS